MNGNEASGLNTNSYLSLGLVVLLIGIVIWLNSQFQGIKDTSAAKFQELHDSNIAFNGEIKNMKEHPSRVENQKVDFRWNSVDMFRWAVRLQRDNPSMKIAEPKHED